MFNLALKEGSYSIENTPSSLNKSMFYYLQSCGYFRCETSYFVDRKDYDTLLLVYTLSGKGYLKYEGKSHIVQKGDIFIIDCSLHHYYASDSDEPWEFKYIHFNGCECRKYFERIVDNGYITMKLPSESTVPGNIDKLLELCCTKNKDLDIKASCIIVEILTELLLFSISHPYKDNLPGYLKEAIDRIEESYNTNMNLDDIARDVNINKFYLTRQFKKYLGQSLYEYILNLRITKSKELLKTTQFSVTEISERVGFESVSHFVKIFKQNEKTTPLKFRKYWI